MAEHSKGMGIDIENCGSRKTTTFPTFSLQHKCRIARGQWRSKDSHKGVNGNTDLNSESLEQFYNWTPVMDAVLESD